MTTSNVGSSKIRRAMALAQENPQFIQAVDYEPNARDLSAAASAAGLVADVVIDVAVGMRSGIPAGEARDGAGPGSIDSLPNLRLRGTALLRRRRAAHHRVRGAQEPAR